VSGNRRKLTLWRTAVEHGYWGDEKGKANRVKWCEGEHTSDYNDNEEEQKQEYEKGKEGNVNMNTKEKQRRNVDRRTCKKY